MQAALKQYWQYTLYTITKKINGVLYFLRKIPVVKNIISPSLFSQYELKQIFTGLYFVVYTLFSTMMKFFLLGLYYFLAMITMNAIHSDTLDLLQFNPFVMTLGLLLWGLTTSGLYNINNVFGLADKNEQDFLLQFQISRRVFLPRSLLMGVSKQLIMYIPALLVYSFLGKNFLYLPAGLAVYASGPYLGSWCSRLVYQIKGGRIAKWLYTLLVILLSVTIYLACCFLQFDYLLILTGSLVIGGALTLISFLGIRKFNQENDYFLYLNEGMLAFKNQYQNAQNKNKQFTSTGLEMQKKLELTDTKDFTNLSGSAYLNALLFDRYRKILNKSLLIRLAVFGIIALLIAFAGLSGAAQDLSLKQENMVKMLPMLFFVMYFCSLGKAIVQMVFVNCDVSMLNYPFYRERTTILSGFNYRFTRTALYNSVISLAIFGNFLIYNFFCNGNLNGQFFLVLALLLVAMTALFSFHELFAYYLLQPFTGDMEVLNPIYRVVSGALYWVSYLNLQIRVSGMTYVIIVSAACLIYVIIGYIVINLKAPQTFRLKG